MVKKRQLLVAGMGAGCFAGTQRSADGGGIIIRHSAIVTAAASNKVLRTFDGKAHFAQIGKFQRMHFTGRNDFLPAADTNTWHANQLVKSRCVQLNGKMFGVIERPNGFGIVIHVQIGTVGG